MTGIKPQIQEAQRTPNRKKKFNLGVSYSNCYKSKIERHPKKRDTLPMEEQKEMLQEPSHQKPYKQKDNGLASLNL